MTRHDHRRRPRRARWWPRLAAAIACLGVAGCSFIKDEFSFLDGAPPHATGAAVGRPAPDAADH